MKVFLTTLFIGLLVVSFAYLAKIIDATRMCYVTRKIDFDELAFRTKAGTWDQRTLCEMELEAIFSLEECLTQTNQKLHPFFREQLSPVINEVIRLWRYGQKDITALSDEHDAQCSAFPLLMVHPPSDGR